MKLVTQRVLIGITASFLVVVAHTASAQTAVLEDPVNASAPDAVAARVGQLKAGMAAKLNKKSKLLRGNEVSDWQQNWGKGTQLDRFDQPQQALTHFLTKRLPEGQATLGLENYSGGLDQAAQMPIFSTPRNQLATATTSGGGGSGGSTTTVVSSVAPGGWEALGPGNVGGRTRAILIHPTTPSTMWASAVGGGIWKSLDAGASWTPKADLLLNIAVNSMVLDPRNPDTIYAGTGEGFFNGDALRGAGILKSTDGGETWAQLPSTNNPDFFYVQKIVLSKGSSQRIYAATRTGVFRSADAGVSWTKVLDGSTVNGCMDLAIQTDRALANVFAACGTFTQAAIYRALDTASTQNWVKVHSPANMGRTTLAIAPSNQNFIYAMSASNEVGNFNNGLLGVYRSTASGGAGSWTTQVSNTSPTKLNTLLLSNPVYGVLTACGFGTTAYFNQGWYDNMLAVDPADPNIVWAGGVDLFRSNDGGQNWGQASHWWFTEGIDVEYNHADQHTIAFHPQYNGTTNKTMFTGNDGGIHITLDARAPVSYSPDPITPSSPVCGNTAASLLAWSTRNNGYQVTQFYHGAVYPDGNTFIAGAQDNGTKRGSVGSQNWSTVNGGDGGYVAVNPANTNMIWFETTNLSMNRSTNGGTSKAAFISGITEASGNFLFIAPIAQDPSNPAIMWTGGARPWRTTQATAVPTVGNIWAQAGPFFGSRISALAVSALDSNLVYTGTLSISGNAALSGVVSTTGAGTTSTGTTAWSQSKPRPGVNYVSWISPDPVAAGTVYATISTLNDATGSGHVFKSTDFGATWVNLDGTGVTGLPDVPAHTIAIDPLNTQRLYVGTDVGVFISTDGGANWARENTGFANVVVEALVIKNTAPRYIYAFTHGRSTFRAAMP